MLIKTILNVDIDPIIEQVNKLGHFGRSICLNETEGNLLSGKYTIKKEFENTPLGRALILLGPDIGEARLLRLDDEDVYTAHTDPDDRYHLVIKTTPYSYLLDLELDCMHKLPVDGYFYHMDTSIMHSAINLGGGERIHLNVRVRMPEYNKPGYRLKFNGGSHDWKHTLYNTMMGYINLEVKNKTIMGFDKVSEREILLNCTEEVLDNIITSVTKNGFTVEVANDSGS
jgi:hypothetical protein